jgi:ElaA protein
VVEGRGSGNIRRIRHALATELSATALYGILRLRSAVFVVEQDCVFLDLDGRDLEPAAQHLWVEEGWGAGGGRQEDGDVVAALRVLAEPVGSSIGRVVTAPSHRSQGLAAELMRRALDVASRPVRINAQAHLAGWYGRFGFAVDGAPFVEDGIPHVGMALP